MNLMITVILAVQLMSALAMIGLILVQHGKGADMGAAFGSVDWAVCLVHRVAPTFCRAPRLFWLQFSLSAL